MHQIESQFEPDSQYLSITELTYSNKFFLIQLQFCSSGKNSTQMNKIRPVRLKLLLFTHKDQKDNQAQIRINSKFDAQAINLINFMQDFPNIDKYAAATSVMQRVKAQGYHSINPQQKIVYDNFLTNYQQMVVYINEHIPKKFKNSFENIKRLNIQLKEKQGRLKNFEENSKLMAQQICKERQIINQKTSIILENVLFQYNKITQDLFQMLKKIQPFVKRKVEIAQNQIDVDDDDRKIYLNQDPHNQMKNELKIMTSKSQTVQKKLKGQLGIQETSILKIIKSIRSFFQKDAKTKHLAQFPYLPESPINKLEKQ